jgi:hypothetical protein
MQSTHQCPLHTSLSLESALCVLPALESCGQLEQRRARRVQSPQSPLAPAQAGLAFSLPNSLDVELVSLVLHDAAMEWKKVCQSSPLLIRIASSLGVQLWVLCTDSHSSEQPVQLIVGCLHTLIHHTSLRATAADWSFAFAQSLF